MMIVITIFGLKVKEASYLSPSTWLKATPFTSTQRYMVKVSGFFASKKPGALTEKPRTAKNPPVVVVRAGKPMPEIIRLEEESLEAHDGET